MQLTVSRIYKLVLDRAGVRQPQFVAFLCGAIAVVLSMASASVSSAKVVDSGQFFSPSVVVRANQLINRMHSKTGKTILVQTFATIPTSIKKEYPHLSQHELFYRWAGTIGRTLHVNGVVIIICRQPGYLIIRSGKATQKTALTLSEQARASQVMLDLFRGGQYESGLIAGLQFITRTIEQKAQAAQIAAGVANGSAAGRSSANLHRMMILIAILVGIFILFWLVTRRGRQLQPPTIEGPSGGVNPQTSGLTPETTTSGAGPQTGGTSAMSSLVSGVTGGAVGAIAGNMLYNSIEGKSSIPVSPVQPGTTTPSNAGSPGSDGVDLPADNASDWSNSVNDDADGGAFGGSDDDSAADVGDDTAGDTDTDGGGAF